MKALPIDEVLPELVAALRTERRAVLVAEPGAGKTTRVPLALLDQPWLGGQRVVMLEPRRLAARSAAQYMAERLGERVGERVGYRVRLDSKVGPRTVIEVVTEGVLTRMLQDDPSLEGVGAVLFDEFHERHLHGDLGLALSLQTAGLLRDELRLLVMSATLDAAPIAELLGGAPVIRSRGRMYPVDTHYAAARSIEPLEARMGAAIMEALRGHEGDVLAFLPGTGEIRRTARRLAERGLPPGVHVRELHGLLTLDAQAAAVAAAPPGERKIVLATAIAESSLTVEGVRIVVDSGLMRVSRFSPRTGMSRLETVPVSKASADQRRGRAGRLAPGVCYRLWSEAEHAGLPEQGRPEMLETDLAALALELAVWGIRDPLELDWLTPPPAPAYESAVQLLQSLGALGADGMPTPAGKRIAALGLHPRLGAMLLRAAEAGRLEEGCELAALLSERDLLPGERNADIALRLDALRRSDEPGARRMRQQAGQWRRLLEGAGEAAAPAKRASGPAAPAAAGSKAAASAAGESHAASPGAAGRPSLGALLAHAYPDRIAQRRSDGRYLLANGRGAVLPHEQPLSRLPYLVACELDDAGAEGTIRLAESVTQEEIERELAPFLQDEEALEWEEGARAIRGRRRLRLGALVLKERPLEAPDPERLADIWLDVVRRKGLAFLPMSKAAAALLGRLRLMSASGADGWPDVGEPALLASLEEWLKPHLYGVRTYGELQKLNMAALLEGMLTWKQRTELDEQAPTHWVVPSGSRIPIDYSDPGAPSAAVRLQELFGLRETPRLAGGRLPLTLHLLSPAQRPVQVTRDLASFWEHAYFEVKKDLKGRYPKHYWPDNPYEAVPTNRAKPRTSS